MPRGTSSSTYMKNILWPLEVETSGRCGSLTLMQVRPGRSTAIATGGNKPSGFPDGSAHQLGPICERCRSSLFDPAYCLCTCKAVHGPVSKPIREVSDCYYQQPSRSCVPASRHASSRRCAARSHADSAGALQHRTANHKPPASACFH